MRRVLADSGLDPPGSRARDHRERASRATPRSLASCTQLKSLGVRLAIDDFGTGYSSLSYLQRFPIDILKIDKSFVDLIGVGVDQQKVVQTIIQLGVNLHMDTVAEGVEHESQMHALRNLGCQFAQGFHFAEPVPPEEIEPMLAALELNVSA